LLIEKTRNAEVLLILSHMTAFIMMPESEIWKMQKLFLVIKAMDPPSYFWY